MGSKAINVFVFIALSSCLIQTMFAKPREIITVGHDQSVVPLNNEAFLQKESTEKDDSSVPVVKIPGRIPCEFEEATEDTVCQEHCLPKGYTYGICVRRTCSCI